MIRIVVDDELVAKFTGHDSKVELCDGAGRIVGQFIPMSGTSVPKGLECPFSDEELERRSREPGRPLEDIFRDLKKRA